MKIYKTIPISELVVQNDSEVEQNRVRLIFENIRERGSLGLSLTEHEKDFFGICLESSFTDEGILEDYPFLENFRFKTYYLTYYYDFTGGEKYYKLDHVALKIFQFQNPGVSSLNRRDFLKEVSAPEVKKDLDFLIVMANSWNSVIDVTNHSNSLLQYVSKETRDQIALLDKRPEFYDMYSKGGWLYKYQKMKIVLQLKYIYLATIEVFESMKSDDFLLFLNGCEIEYNEYSIVHILSRHFAALTKPFDTGKSYHNMDFLPKQLNLQLKEIFKMISDTGLYVNDSIQKISFVYKGIAYSVHTNSDRFKQIKGKGNVAYTRVETFYPIEIQKELIEIQQNYLLKEVNNDLSVYCKISNSR
jgi:hypothetical protein